LIGIPEERILFLNLLSAPEGIIAFKEKFPQLRIVTAFVDEGLDSRKWSPQESCVLILDSLFLDAVILETDSSERIRMALKDKVRGNAFTFRGVGVFSTGDNDSLMLVSYLMLKTTPFPVPK
jgi:hypothetical protein